MSKINTLLVAAGIIAVFSVFLGYIFTQTNVRGTQSVEHALDSLSPCFTARNPEDKADLACLEREVNELLSKFPTHAVMSKISASTSPLVVVRNCHLIGHMIGHKTFQRTPSLEDAYEQCTASCKNSCVHGVTTEAISQELGESYVAEDLSHADGETLATIGKRYCDRQKVLCHSVGHLLRIALKSYQAALPICEQMGTNKIDCYKGVFMEDAASIELTTRGLPDQTIAQENYVSPCASVPTKYGRQCFWYLHLYQSSLFEKNGISTTAEQLRIFRNACDSLPDQQRAWCYYGMGGNAYRDRDEDGSPVDIVTFCDPIIRSVDRTQCTVGIVRSYFTTVLPRPDRARTFCEQQANVQLKNTCYETVFTLESESLATSSIEALCGPVPSIACTAAFNTYTPPRNPIESDD